MGASTNAILVLGWNLGSPDDQEVEWAVPLLERLQEADDTDDVILECLGTELPPNPWDEIADKPSEWYRDPLHSGDSREYAAWKESTAEARQRRYDARRDALDGAGFELVRHCSGEYPMWLLTLKDYSWEAYRGSPKDVGNVLSLADSVDYETAHARLHTAAVILGLDPPEPPTLLLASYMDY